MTQIKNVNENNVYQLQNKISLTQLETKNKPN